MNSDLAMGDVLLKNTGLGRPVYDLRREPDVGISRRIGTGSPSRSRAWMCITRRAGQIRLFGDRGDRAVDDRHGL